MCLHHTGIKIDHKVLNVENCHSLKIVWSFCFFLLCSKNINYRLTWNASYDGVAHDHFINNICITCSIRGEEKKN